MPVGPGSCAGSSSRCRDWAARTLRTVPRQRAPRGSADHPPRPSGGRRRPVRHPPSPAAPQRPAILKQQAHHRGLLKDSHLPGPTSALNQQVIERPAAHRDGVADLDRGVGLAHASRWGRRQSTGTCRGAAGTRGLERWQQAEALDDGQPMRAFEIVGGQRRRLGRRRGRRPAPDSRRRRAAPRASPRRPARQRSARQSLGPASLPHALPAFIRARDQCCAGLGRAASGKRCISVAGMRAWTGRGIRRMPYVRERSAGAGPQALGPQAAVTEGVGDRRATGVDAKLGVDVHEMPIDRLLAEHEPRGDRPVGEPLGDQPQHLPLARRQRGAAGSGRRVPPAGR